MPAIFTNKRFMAGRDDGFGLDDAGRKRAYRKARAQGINPNGKVWSPQLNSWYSSKDDVKRICEAKGWSAEGSVNVKAPQIDKPEPKGYTVAPDIVNREVERIVEENKGDVTPKEKARLKEETRERLSGNQD